MYIPALNLSVLCIPKCGTHTITEAFESKFGKCYLPGHVKAVEHRNRYPHAPVLAFIRDPWERFISQINYGWGDVQHKMDLDAALTAFFRDAGKKEPPHLTTTQAHWIDKRTELCLFSNLEAKLRDLGCETVGVLNKGPGRWSLNDLRDTGRMDEIEAFLKPDLLPWSAAEWLT